MAQRHPHAHRSAVWAGSWQSQLAAGLGEFVLVMAFSLVGVDGAGSGRNHPKTPSIHSPSEWRVKGVVVRFPAGFPGSAARPGPVPAPGFWRFAEGLGHRLDRGGLAAQAAGGSGVTNRCSSRGSTTPFSTRLVITATATRASICIARSAAS